MAGNMSMDDMSFVDLLDTCQAHLKRARTEVESSQGKARYAQSNGLEPQLPSVSTGRQRLDPPRNDPGSQGMASSETKYWSHMLPPSGQLP